MPGKRGAPERFLTTVLMTDIVGSTDHAAELGDSAWRELVQQHHALVRAALRRHGGREIDTAGDGFFATFDAPAAAVRCALEISEAVGKLGLEVRAGIHVGEVEQIGRKVGGITVPIASRMMSNAAPGEILVSSTVRDLAAGSGLTFDDRGTRELKGVPGEWHVFAVSSGTTSAAAEGDEPAIAQRRRASAVQRASARPIWQRRPRLVAAAVIGLAVILATTGLLAWKPWQTPALAGLAENSIGIIDPARGELVGQVQVGSEPSGIAVGEGYLWVSNAADNTISQIDPATKVEVRRIDVGQRPAGVALAGGSVWVANSGGRTVTRINATTGRAVQEVEVGNAPRALVAVDQALWVVNSTDSTVVRIDAASGATGAPVGVAGNPVAIAADDSSMWVASEDLASVSRLDPTTGSTLAVIPLGVRPTALALGSDWLWVASSEGAVTWIDRTTNRVNATIPLGTALTAIALSDDAVWLADRAGIVHRLDRNDPLAPARHVPTETSVAALAVVEGEAVWLATQRAPGSHRGGTLRVYMPSAYSHPTDPLGNPFGYITSLQGDGLLGHRRAGGAAGATLLPNLATSIPTPADGGLTYRFSLRRDIFYSTGEPVQASDFRRAIERSFQVPSSFFGLLWGEVLFTAAADIPDAPRRPIIIGTDACLPSDDGATPVERCDLAAGIVVDDAAGTVTFHLAEADPDFLFKLATPFTYAVPASVPMDRLLEGAFPATGPYVVASANESEVRLVRNERFTARDEAVRPDGFSDEIFVLLIDCPDGTCATEAGDSALRSVESGGADVMSLGPPARLSDELVTRLHVQYPDRWHFGSAGTHFVVLDTSRPPFDSLDVRQAVSFAYDRGTVGAQNAATCQLIPPGWPGYAPYCPYTLNVDEGGRWMAPDLAQARDLIAASGTSGMHVTVGPAFEFFATERDYLASVLTALDYEVTIDSNSDRQHVRDSSDTAQITFTGWGADYLSASNFLGLYRCHDELDYCDPTGQFDADFERAQSLQATDTAAANAAWAELDHWAVDQAIIVPLSNPGGYFVSDRVGNYQFHPSGVVLLDQLWVQ